MGTSNHRGFAESFVGATLPTAGTMTAGAVRAAGAPAIVRCGQIGHTHYREE